MSRRAPAGPRTPRVRPERKAANPWVIRAIVAVAVVILAVGLVYAAVHGVLFSRPAVR